MCEIQGMTPNFALSGGTFRVQHLAGQAARGQSSTDRGGRGARDIILTLSTCAHSNPVLGARNSHLI